MTEFCIQGADKYINKAIGTCTCTLTLQDQSRILGWLQLTFCTLSFLGTIEHKHLVQFVQNMFSSHFPDI